MARPVREPKDMPRTVMIRPTMKAFMPAPGGALVSSPRARTEIVNTEVDVSSTANARGWETHGERGKVRKLDSRVRVWDGGKARSNDV